MINRVVLVGRTTRDPELKQTSSNPVATFTIAIDNRGKDKDGKKTTSFFTCVVFGAQADSVAKNVKKGKLIGIEGRLNQRSWTKQDGSKGSTVEILCDSVQFLEKRDAVDNEEPDVPPFDDEVPESDDDNKNIDSLDITTNDLPF